MTEPRALSRLSVAPQQLKTGDKFTHRGADYEVVRTAKGRYGNVRVICWRLSLEDIGLDYQAVVEVERARV